MLNFLPPINEVREDFADFFNALGFEIAMFFCSLVIAMIGIEVFAL